MSPTVFKFRGYRFFFFSREEEGIWLIIEGKEYFLSYQEYPWFKDARLSEIQSVQLLHGIHLYWPKLDVDLSINNLEYPEKYPLTYL